MRLWNREGGHDTLHRILAAAPAAPAGGFAAGKAAGILKQRAVFGNSAGGFPLYADRRRGAAVFFHHDYSTPGPGVAPDAPEKTGFARFFEIVQLECMSLLKLNLLFLLSALPVVTIPPALFAMNQVVRRMVLDQPVDCFYHYRQAFRRYWRVSYPAFLAVASALVVSGYGMFFYLRGAGDNPLLLAPFVLCSTVFLVTCLSSACFYGALSLGRPLGEALRLGVLLGVGRPLRGLASALCVYGLLTAAVLAFPLSAIYLIFIGFSLPCLLANFYVRTVLKQYVGDGGAEEA